MKLGNFFYEVEFRDGKIIRRNHVTRKIAEAASEIFVYEMELLNVVRIEWGPMK